MDEQRGSNVPGPHGVKPSEEPNEINRPENSPSPTEQEVNKPPVSRDSNSSGSLESEIDNATDNNVTQDSLQDKLNANGPLEVPSNENSQPNGLSPKKPSRNVSFPTDSNIVMGYLEPQDPWKNVPNWRTEDLIRAYRRSCERHGAKPLNKLLQQLQCIENVGERYEILSLKGERLDMKQCESIEEILRHVRFRCIDLEATHLDDEMAVSLFEMVEFYESACKLNISFNKNIGVRGWQSCSRLVRKTPCLTFVDARNCDLNERVIPIMGRALRMGCYLTRLQLQSTNLAGRALVILVAALKMNEVLKELFIGDNKFLPTDGVHIGNLLKFNHKLELLDLRNNHLQDVGLNHICDGLKEQILDTGLLTLVMWNNQITFQGMGPVNRALAVCEHIETLNLGHNPITNEGIHILKDGLLKSRSLIKLGLSGTKVTCEGAVALAEVIADSPRLVRLDLQENDIKTAGLMALSLALKVNESLTRLDIDRDTKKESGMKDYAEQQRRLQQDISSLLDRNRDLTHKREEERRQIELKNQENARKLQEAAQDIEVDEKEEEAHAYIPSEDKIHRPKLLFLPSESPQHELDSPAIDSEIAQSETGNMPHLQMSGHGSDLLSPQYCPDPKGTAKKLFSVSKAISPNASSTGSKSSSTLKSFATVCSPSNDISSPVNMLDPLSAFDVPQLCVPLPTTALPTHSTDTGQGGSTSSLQDIVSPSNLQKVIEEQTLVTYIQQIVGNSSGDMFGVVPGETPALCGVDDSSECVHILDKCVKDGNDGGDVNEVEGKGQSCEPVDKAESMCDKMQECTEVSEKIKNSISSDCDIEQMDVGSNASGDLTARQIGAESSVNVSKESSNCNNSSVTNSDTFQACLKDSESGVSSHCDRDYIPKSETVSGTSSSDQIVAEELLHENKGKVPVEDSDNSNAFDEGFSTNPQEKGDSNIHTSSQRPKSSFADCDVLDHKVDSLEAMVQTSIAESCGDHVAESKTLCDRKGISDVEKCSKSDMKSSSISDKAKGDLSVMHPTVIATEDDFELDFDKERQENKHVTEAGDINTSSPHIVDVHKDGRLDSGDLEQWNTVSQSDIADLETPVLVPALSEGSSTSKPDFFTSLSMNGMCQELASVIDEEGNQVQLSSGNEVLGSVQRQGTSEVKMPNGTEASSEWIDASSMDSES